MIELMAMALASAVPQSSTIGLIDGNAVMVFCDGDSRGKLACTAWLRGTLDMAQVAQARSGTCEFELPRGVSLDQAQDVIVKWLKDNPAQRHHSAALLALRALGEAFPCPR